MDGERLRRIRNWQSDDWYAAVFVRPVVILVMLVMADWTWVSPNMLTTLSTLMKSGAIALILVDEHWAWITAAILLQVGLLVDNMDGTLARYRGCQSVFGSFYDKVGDALTWLGITLAVGWRASIRHHDHLLLALAAYSAYALLMSGYMKWLLETERERTKWRTATDDPAAAVAIHSLPAPISTPPERTRGDWVRWYLKSWLQIYRFEEADLFFWVGLFLLLDRPWELCWGLALSQTAVLLVRVARGIRLARQLDRQRRAAAPVGKRKAS